MTVSYTHLGLHYELLFLESLKLVVRPGHPLLQETVTLSRVMEWPVVVSPKGTVPRQNAEALLQSQGCKMPAGCIETLSASLSRQLTVDFDYVWFVPSGAVKDLSLIHIFWRNPADAASRCPAHGGGSRLRCAPRRAN